MDVKIARCNLPPHTIMRGPGFLQGVMVAEQVLEHVAAELSLDPAAVKAINFIAPPAGALPSLAGGIAVAAGDFRTSNTAGGSQQPRRLCAGSPAAALKQRQSGRAAAREGDRAPTPSDGHAASGVDIAATPHQLGVTAAGAHAAGDDQRLQGGSFTLPTVWEQLLRDCDYHARRKAAAAWNDRHVWRKRALAVTPVK